MYTYKGKVDTGLEQVTLWETYLLSWLQAFVSPSYLSPTKSTGTAVHHHAGLQRPSSSHSSGQGTGPKVVCLSVYRGRCKKQQILGKRHDVVSTSAHQKPNLRAIKTSGKNCC